MLKEDDLESMRKRLNEFRDQRQKTSAGKWVRDIREVMDGNRVTLTHFGGMTARQTDIENAKFLVLAHETRLPDDLETLLDEVEKLMATPEKKRAAK